MASPTASDVLVETLLDWGVDTVFGLPGDGINGIIEALRTHQDRIKFIQVRHSCVSDDSSPERFQYASECIRDTLGSALRDRPADSMPGGVQRDAEGTTQKILKFEGSMSYRSGKQRSCAFIPKNSFHRQGAGL